MQSLDEIDHDYCLPGGLSLINTALADMPKKSWTHDYLCHYFSHTPFQSVRVFIWVLNIQTLFQGHAIIFCSGLKKSKSEGSFNCDNELLSVELKKYFAINLEINMPRGLLLSCRAK